MRKRIETMAAPVQPMPILPALDIRPDGIYTPGQVIAALNLRKSSLRSEWRNGRLRVLRRCGRNFLRGADLLEWLSSGALPSPSKRRGTEGHA